MASPLSEDLLPSPEVAPEATMPSKVPFLPTSCTCLAGHIQKGCAHGCPHAKHLIAASARRVCERRGYLEHTGEVYLRVSDAIARRPGGLSVEYLDGYSASKLRDHLNRREEAWGQNRRAHLQADLDNLDISDGHDDDSGVMESFRSLPPHQRRALALRFVKGLTPRQIAARLGTSEAWVRKTLADGLRALRNGLK